jgi:hypothetical protein
MDARSVATFLKEHYTTKEESAVALASFLAGARGGGDARQNAQVPGSATPNGAKPKTAARGESEPEARPEAKPEARPAPKPRTSVVVEPPRQQEGEGANTREERRQARTPAVPREDTKLEPARSEGAKGEGVKGEGSKAEGEAVVGKLRSYGASGSDVRAIERSAEQSKKPESDANSGATNETAPPADAGTTNAVAAPPADDANAEKRKPTENKPAEKKKKDAAVTSATPGGGPAAHAARPHRPAAVQPPPGNN